MSTFGDNDFHKRVFFSYRSRCNETENERCCNNRSIIEWMRAPARPLERCLSQLPEGADTGACLGGFFVNASQDMSFCPPGL